MIFAELKGGLGNQLFQYAFARSLSYDLDEELFLDVSSFHYDMQDKITHFVYGLQPYDIKGIVGNYPYEDVINRGVSLYHQRTFGEATNYPDDNYTENLSKLELPAYFTGFWNNEILKTDNKQYISERYFAHNNDIIREDLEYTSKIHKKYAEIISDMANYDAVAVHLRRGEYKDFSEYGTCSVKYYMDAISNITRNLSNPKLYIFTEDHEWAENNLSFNLPYEHVYYHEEKNQVARGYGGLLKAMSSCDHFIIANSTFSWWGAWLSENKNKKIISPKPWFHSNRMIQANTIDNITLEQVTSNYKELFDKEKEVIFDLNAENYVKAIKQVNNVELYVENNLLNIKTLENDSRIILENINKNNGDNALIIELKLVPDYSSIFNFFLLTKDSLTYEDKNRLDYYYYKNDEFTQYIILPNTIQVNDIMIRPSARKNVNLKIKSFKIKEMGNIDESFSV